MYPLLTATKKSKKSTDRKQKKSNKSNKNRLKKSTSVKKTPIIKILIFHLFAKHEFTMQPSSSLLLLSWLSSRARATI
jgi:hypothetical protein